LQIVGGANQVRETEINLALSGRGDFVMMTFDVDAAFG
jgi:hypothetical protein